MSSSCRRTKVCLSLRSNALCTTDASPQHVHVECMVAGTVQIQQKQWQKLQRRSDRSRGAQIVLMRIEEYAFRYGLRLENSS